MIKNITKYLLCLSLLMLFMTACKTTTSKNKKNKKNDEIQLPDFVKNSKELAKKTHKPDESPLIVSELVPERSVGENELKLPLRESKPEKKQKYLDYPASLLKGVGDPNKKMEVMFNFDAAALTEIVPLFAELLKFSYLVDPSVKGAVTMTVNTKMTAKETWSMFQHILWLSGAYCSMNEEFLHIMPFSKMSEERRLLVDHDPIANVEVAFLHFRKITSAEAVALIKPFMTKGATITNIKRLNTLLIVEAPTNMPKIRELVKRIDEQWQMKWPQISIRCHSVDSDDIVEELMKILPVIGLPVTKSKSDAMDIKIMSIPRLQVIISSAPTKELLQEVERWVKVLDREDIGEQEHIYFYNIKHSNIEELHNGLNAFFNTSGESRTKKTGSVSQKASKGSSKRRSVVRRRSTSKQTNKQGESDARSSIFEVPVTIHEDGLHNRLLIRTTPRTYALITALLERLDIPPSQVLIQALIVDVTLTNSLKYGFSYAARSAFSNNFHGAYGSNNMIDLTKTDSSGNIISNNFRGASSSLLPGNISSGASGINFLFANKNAAMDFILEVAGESNTTILSAPQVLAIGDKEAVIDVGEQVSIVDSTDYTSSSVGTAVDHYAYKDAGIVLTVTPHITANNEVTLELEQSVDNFLPLPADAKQGQQPTIQKRRVKTELIVPDGQTVLLGGIIKTNNNIYDSGFPLLKDIPILGNLFKYHSSTRTKTELLILVTVNVVDNSTRIEKMLRHYKNSLKEINRVFPSGAKK